MLQLFEIGLVPAINTAHVINTEVGATQYVVRATQSIPSICVAMVPAQCPISSMGCNADTITKFILKIRTW